MKFSDFDRIECLCVDARCNEWDRIDKEFGKYGTPIDKFIAGKGIMLPKQAYNFIDPPHEKTIVPPGWYSRGFTNNAYYCYLCHRKILERALQDNVKTLLMLEDDCQLMDNAETMLEKASQQMVDQNIQWDMLYLGANHTWANTKEISDNVVQCLFGTYCWHCVAINQQHHNMIKELLSLPPMGAFDWLSSQKIQPKFNCYAVWPTVAIQRPGLSNVLGSIQDYTHYFNTKGNVVV
jgi:GR25 family glycosyltransferase involved in LPS biosynthesis